MKGRVLLAAMVAWSGLAIDARASDWGRGNGALTNSNCQAAFQKWKAQSPRHRAFAATPHGSRQNCGYSYDWDTQEHAIRVALGYCRAVLPRVMGTCRVIAAD